MSEKPQRQAILLELVKQQAVSNQHELVDLLIKNGFSATQASISRDIRELGLVKVNGRYVPATQLNGQSPTTAKDPLNELITGMEPIGSNLIVVHTKTGAASTVAVELDCQQIDDIVGTIAGDDTIFIAVRSRSTQGRVLALLKGRQAGHANP